MALSEEQFKKFIEAPLKFADNLDKANQKLKEVRKTAETIGSTVGKSPGLKKQKEDTDKLSQAQKELAKVNKQVEIAQAKQNKEYIAAQKQLKELRESQKRLVNGQKEQLGTLERLRKANKDLTKEREGLNLATQRGQKRLRDINKQLDANNKVIKNNSSQLEKQKINIGNYGSALSGLSPRLGAAVSGIQAMTKAALTFMATPIGAVIAALGIAIGALTEYFRGSEEGQNAFNKASKALGVVLGNLSDIVQKLGKFLFESFSNPKQALEDLWNFIKDRFITQFEGLTGLFEAIAEFDFEKARKSLVKLVTSFDEEQLINGFNAVKNGVSDLIAETEREIEIQNRLSDLRAKTDLLERELTVKRAKLQRQINELREKAAAKEEFDAKTRIGFITDAIRLQEDLAKAEERVANNRFIIAKTEAELSNSTKEDLDEIATLEARLDEIQAERAKKTKSLQAELTTAIREYKKEVGELGTKIQELPLPIPDAMELKTELQKTNDEIKKSILQRAELYEEDKENAIKIEQEKQQGIRDLINQGIDETQNIISGFSQFRIDRLSEESNALEIQRQTELQNAEGNARSQILINEKFDREQRKIKQKQFRVNQTTSVANIAIDTAQKVAGIKTNAALLASNPATLALVPLALAQIPIAIGVGLAQTALVLAQKPKFKKGTDNAPGTGFIAGDGGSELILTKSGGALLTPDTDTYYQGKMFEGATVLPHPKTEEILGTLEDAKLRPNVTFGKKVNEVSNLELEQRRTNAILSQIMNRPIHQQSLDPEGIKNYIINALNKTEVKNSRFGDWK